MKNTFLHIEDSDDDPVAASGLFGVGNGFCFGGRGECRLGRFGTGVVGV